MGKYGRSYFSKQLQAGLIFMSVCIAGSIVLAYSFHTEPVKMIYSILIYGLSCAGFYAVGMILLSRKYRANLNKIRNGEALDSEFIEDKDLKEFYDSVQIKLKEIEKEKEFLQILKKSYRVSNEDINRDSMTQLFTKQYLYKMAPLEIEKSVTLKQPFSILMIDVDHFKHYNDTNGHLLGDEVLIQIADIVRNSVRSNDLAVRYGGEEFLLFLTNAPKKYAVNVAQRVNKSIECENFKKGELQPLGRITVSIGVAAYPEDGKKIKELIDIADQHLYQAKRNGRNQVCE